LQGFFIYVLPDG